MKRAHAARAKNFLMLTQLFRQTGFGITDYGLLGLMTDETRRWGGKFDILAGSFPSGREWVALDIHDRTALDRARIQTLQTNAASLAKHMSGFEVFPLAATALDFRGTAEAKYAASLGIRLLSPTRVKDLSSMASRKANASEVVSYIRGL